MKRTWFHAILLLVFFLGACTSQTPGPQPASPQPLPSATLRSPTASSQNSLSPSPLIPTSLPPETASPSPLPPIPTPALPTPTRVVPPPRHIILVIVDSLRADHLSAYGYERATTPRLDELVAERGVRFDHAIATAPWTCPSVAALMSGRMPGSLKFSIKNIQNTLPKKVDTLAEALREQGYFTAGFVPTYCTKGRLGFDQGFEYYDDSLTDRQTSEKVRAAEINRLAMDWLEEEWLPEQDGSKRLFLMLYYFDPHTYHDPLPPYDTLFDQGYTGSLTPEVFRNGEPIVSGEIVPTSRDVEHVVALYDGEINYWDEQFAQMMEFMQANGLLDNTLLVLTSDHGEMFSEHGQWGHGSSLYQEVLRVPFMMRYEGVIPAGTVVEAPVQNFDLMPTILEWAGATPNKEVQAVSLVPAALGLQLEPGRPVFSEQDALLDKRNPLYWTIPHVSYRSVEQDGWKLIHTLEKPETDELFHLNPASIYEIENLMTSQPGMAQELLITLKKWFGLRP